MMPEMQQQQHPLLPSSTTSAAAAPEVLEYDPHIPESIPPWVHVNDGDEDAPLFLQPAPIVPNTRHYKPQSSNLKPGKRLDQYRSAEPGLLSAPIEEHQARWIPFMQSSPAMHEQRDVRIIRSPQWMEENVPISSREWDPEDEISPEATKRLGGWEGIMFGGKWFISPERQERTVKLFWVRNFLNFQAMACIWNAYLCAAAPSQKRICPSGISIDGAGFFVCRSRCGINHSPVCSSSQRRSGPQQPVRTTSLYVHGHHC